jgi:hypothetical protein
MWKVFHKITMGIRIPQILTFYWWCSLFEAFLWFLLVVGVFAVLNRMWFWLFLKAEASRLEGSDEFAEASASMVTDPRAARSI